MPRRKIELLPEHQLVLQKYVEGYGIHRKEKDEEGLQKVIQDACSVILKTFTFAKVKDVHEKLQRVI